MATKEDKYEANVEGKFYVDTECIDCNLCRETAPNNFTNHHHLATVMVVNLIWS